VLVIVQPDILKHGKYRTLRASIGGPVALEVLLALWGHVQTSSSRKPDLILDDAEEIALICGYRGNAKRLKDALMYVPPGYTNGFLVQSEVPGMLQVYAWAEMNKELLTRRENGKRGGRPTHNRTETGRLSDRLSGAEPTGHPSRVEESRVDINPPTPQGESEGDEAHRILVESPNLRGVSWEEDRRIRCDRSDIRDWIPVARWAADKAHDMAAIDHPVAWLRRRYGDWGRQTGRGGAQEGVVPDMTEARNNRVRKIEDIPDVLPPSILKRRAAR